jgi:hypothetical protein
MERGLGKTPTAGGNIGGIRRIDGKKVVDHHAGFVFVMIM